LGEHFPQDSRRDERKKDGPNVTPTDTQTIDAPEVSAPEAPKFIDPAPRVAPWQPSYQPAMAAPAPAYYVQVPAAPRSSSTALAMGILVILGALVAGLAGYVLAQQTSPAESETARTQQVAAREGYFAGERQGLASGREFGRSTAGQLASTQAAISSQNAWNRGYRKGRLAGKRSVRNEPTYTGWGRGYTPRWGGYGGYNNVGAALGNAQMLANATGSPVDVEIY
jgi:hypothetical protein